ncbi:hypothetical protein GGR58DRAFT_491350 [Xylaria digitata]|nr:hypothetical protein GGR58DRAFT_491350 [Xylaria digitata]
MNPSLYLKLSLNVCLLTTSAACEFVGTALFPLHINIIVLSYKLCVRIHISSRVAAMPRFTAVFAERRGNTSPAVTRGYI